ncbi:reverse transcriptase domain-containing protein [Tanacetum coccineum]|uniref:Reverse transcriptase domain-containing protein n=1 Tax=Tanacetum coccineum TaxID=301880 RepID=A0ABQ4X446_9ASTR
MLYVKDVENGISRANSDYCSYDTEGPTWRIDSHDTAYRIEHNNDSKRERLYLASANEIDKKKPELKNIPSHLEYAYLNNNESFPHKGAIAWKISDIKGIIPSFYTHKILIKEDFKLVIQLQRCLNLKVQDVVKDEIVKLLDSGLIYLISDSSWVSPIYVVPKKGGITVVLNDNDLFPLRTVTGWRVCIDYRKLNDATRKDHFPLPFIDQMLKRLSEDFMEVFMEDFMEVFMDNFSVFDTSFDNCLANLDKMLARAGIEVDETKIDVIAKLSYPTNVKGLMCDASDFAVGFVSGQRVEGKFKPIYYAIKMLNNTQEHYTTTEKELLAIVFAFDKFWPYLVLSKTVVYTNHSALKQKGSKNLAADHLSRLENPKMEILTDKEIADDFPDEHLRIPTRGHHSASVTGRKVYEAGFYWHDIFKDAKDFVTKCDACHKSGNISSRMAVDYVSKRVEAQAFPTNDARVVVKFLREFFARFGVPRALISDKGTHFCNTRLERALPRYGVTHKLSTAYHPQSNGQTEVTNKVIKWILERSVGYNPKDWSKKLNDALWAFRTAYKMPTSAEKNRFMELNELGELRDGAYENTRIYKERTKKWHDSRLWGDKDLKVGDKVLMYNSRLKLCPGKLRSKWHGPFIVKTVYPYKAIEITNENNVKFKVNGQRLKKYHDEEFDKEMEVVEFENEGTK